MDVNNTSMLERFFWKEISMGKKVTIELSVPSTIIYVFYSYHRITRYKFKDNRQLFQILSVLNDNTVIFDSRITEETWLDNIDPKAIKKCSKVIIMPIVNIPDDIFYKLDESKKKIMSIDINTTNESTITWYDTF
ncbi:SWPV1-254 [Shearwaterpox virus]|uniref:SWPV1-254 n=1 Tax=Shearwaterpox virus TaxID=1974596 RepID=A0A1V0S864_CNPV|nr:SWPV1-254 [Shearwaterpox virus]